MEALLVALQQMWQTFQTAFVFSFLLFTFFQIRESYSRVRANGEGIKWFGTEALGGVFIASIWALCLALILAVVCYFAPLLWQWLIDLRQQNMGY